MRRHLLSLEHFSDTQRAAVGLVELRLGCRLWRTRNDLRAQLRVRRQHAGGDRRDAARPEGSRDRRSAAKTQRADFFLRQLGISTSGVSKILSRSLSSYLTTCLFRSPGGLTSRDPDTSILPTPDPAWAQSLGARGLIYLQKP